MSRAAFIEPCLPSPADHPPSGDAWLHEIKHDGFGSSPARTASEYGSTVGPGNDLTDRFRLIVAGLARLPARSCIIDGEAVALLRLRLHWRGGSRRYLRGRSMRRTFLSR